MRAPVSASWALVALVACLCFSPVIHAFFAVDVNDAVSQSQWQCIKGRNYARGIVRAWRSTGTFDTNAPATIKAAKAAGIGTIDVYLFPCAGKSASEQVTDMISELQKSGVSWDTIWLDIETNPSSGCGWPSSTTTNCKYIQELIAAAGSHPVGVYVSAAMWTEVAGSSCNVGASKPLWYPHFDNDPSFSDFSPFGGWTKPAMKQYDEDRTVCEVEVDNNYYEEGTTTSSSSSGTKSSSSSATRTSSSSATRASSSSGTRSTSGTRSSASSGGSKSSGGGSKSSGGGSKSSGGGSKSSGGGSKSSGGGSKSSSGSSSNTRSSSSGGPVTSASGGHSSSGGPVTSGGGSSGGPVTSGGGSSGGPASTGGGGGSSGGGGGSSGGGGGGSSGGGGGGSSGGGGGGSGSGLGFW
eukprot:TRINITY_DN294_c0_g1_i2.p1 TRINITY_DN294_c0_g1~~TRINITY_DN294_c0_g1_i2.p1  ORF type:complete len:410 (-),score=61.92 TRINITY_DN294_c0_g1_i2:121-1350(-)